MVGLDISDQTVKLVCLATKAARPLLAHCWQEVPAGVIERGIIQRPAEVAKIVAAALSLCRVPELAAEPVVAVLPDIQSFLRVVELPAMPADEMTEAVRWEVGRHIPFGLENVYIDWQPVGGGHQQAVGRQEVLVGAAQRRAVDSLVAALRELKLEVAALELESQAIVRALISPELRRRRGLLVVDLGGTATNVVIHDHGAMRFTASLQRGVRDLTSVLPPDDAVHVSLPQQPKLAGDVVQRMAGQLQAGQEALVLEIRGIVEFYNGIDDQHEVREILLTGGGSNLPGLDAVFLRLFGNVHVQRGNPWVNILRAGKEKQLPLSLQESVHFTTALGAALRPVAA